jgi:hypothetical protein
VTQTLLVSPGPERKRGVRFADAALRDSRLGVLLLCSAIPLLIAASAMLLSPVVLSREMTWDFLFNLAGAWHVHAGQAAHVDFHDPLGALNFYLTAFGFRLLGPQPAAFVVGTVAVTAAVSAAAALVAWRRLPLLPATLFVLFTGFQILMPSSPGDQPNAYSFAMSYNRYGWSACGVLALLLFVPPRAGHRGVVLDLSIATLLLVALFYIKITYFAVGLLATACAIVVSSHIRARRVAWTVAGVAVTANALAPYSHPYLVDIVGAAQTGAVRDNLIMHANFFLDHATEYACMLAFAGIALWLWKRRQAPASLPFAIAFLLGAGVFLLTQNSQSHAMPFGVVAALMIYDALRQKLLGPAPLAPLLLVLLVFPILPLVAAAASVAGYVRAAASTGDLSVVAHTNLRGLAVPATDTALLAAFSGEPGPAHELLGRSRETRPRHELLAAEYVETLLEASDILGADTARGVVVLDQVNPLPFMLGLVPPKGGDLWSDGSAPRLPPDSVLRDADVVLVPKFSTWLQGTAGMLAAYSGYLAAHFGPGEESRSWFVFRRKPGSTTGAAAAGPGT